MTDRLYYEDAYLLQFEGKVIAQREEKGIWLALDRSAFYPTSGGQPYDTGEIRWPGGAVQVMDVEVDQEGIVWHRVTDILATVTFGWDSTENPHYLQINQFLPQSFSFQQMPFLSF